jgi:hypothetical protein
MTFPAFIGFCGAHRAILEGPETGFSGQGNGEGGQTILKVAHRQK